MQIEHQCPQCGGPVILEESDRFLSCGFCRTNLYILSSNFLRYYLRPTKHPIENSIFVPYWRLRGMYYSVGSFEIKSKVIDTSFISEKTDFLPLSLGLRPQALKLRFADPKMKTAFVGLKNTFSEVLSSFRNGQYFFTERELGERVFHRAFVGEAVSAIYFPIYIKNRAIYDGILDRPVSNLTPLRESRLSNLERRKNWKINFLPAQCPNCGWDMEGERDSVALFCRNCDSSWNVDKGRYRTFPFRIMHTKHKEDLFLPFWRMRVDFEGIEMKFFADLVKVANLPKAMRPEWKRQVLSFWAPAFKVYPLMFQKLTIQLTANQYEIETREELPRGELFPVTLDVREAFEIVLVAIAGMAVAKEKFFPRLSEINVMPKEYELVYIPFKVGGHEYLQPELKMTIQKNTIKNLRRPGT